MRVVIKITNNKHIKNHYNNIAVDKDGNKFFITTNNELVKGSYYLIDIQDYKFNASIDGYTIKILNYNNLEKLSIVNNKLTLNNKPIKAITYKLNKLELKLIEKYNKLKELTTCQLGVDSAKQYNKNEYWINKIDNDIKLIKVKL